ncbi:hypothetical protein LG198_14280 [Methylobacillus arboreus]|uniref:hypothetical protein n=1 Tax=Methylobacillus arboreus TaxID=755170 RepID=UPI001E62EFB5|nr:hypothetical protein [Methylobacillus arboreus]MCB5191897.1 hypothetical protein [Methylobacillus arboreus]
MVKVIDDFLSKDELDRVLFELKTPIETHAAKKIVTNDDYDRSYDNAPAKVEFFDSDYIHCVFSKKLGIELDRNFQRLRTTYKSDDPRPNPPHQDLKTPHITIVWYLYDSDGDLFIYNEQQPSEVFSVLTSVTPLANKLVYFDGSHYHSGNTPKSYAKRVVLNLHSLNNDESHLFID